MRTREKSRKGEVLTHAGCIRGMIASSGPHVVLAISEFKTMKEHESKGLTIGSETCTASR